MLRGEERGGEVCVVQEGDGGCLGRAKSPAWLEDLEGDEAAGGLRPGLEGHVKELGV